MKIGYDVSVDYIIDPFSNLQTVSHISSKYLKSNWRCLLKQFFFLALLLGLFLFLVFPINSSAAELAGYASVSGCIRDDITNQSLSDVKVKLNCGSVHLNTVSDAMGYYEFSSVPIYLAGNKYQNNTRIFVSHRDYKISMLKTKLLPNEIYNFDFYLSTRFKYPIIEGAITDSETLTGISEAMITVSNDIAAYTTTTNNQGEYVLRIENRKVGEYTITAVADGYHRSVPQPLKTFPGQTYTIDFSLEKISLGVSVSPERWNIGALAPYSVKTMTQEEGITVINSGNANQTYSLMVVSPSGWKASQTNISLEQYILNACFSSSLDIIIWDETKHALSELAQTATESKFAQDQNGVNVASQEERLLWLQFKAPTSTVLSEEQCIELIINTEIP